MSSLPCLQAVLLALLFSMCAQNHEQEQPEPRHDEIDGRWVVQQPHKIAPGQDHSET